MIFYPVESENTSLWDVWILPVALPMESRRHRPSDEACHLIGNVSMTVAVVIGTLMATTSIPVSMARDSK